MGFVSGMLSGLVRSNIPVDDLLEREAGETAQRGGRLPVSRYAELFNRAIARSQDEAVCLFSRPLRPGTFEFLCRSVLGAATLEEGLDRARRFLSLVLDDLEVTLTRRETHAELTIREVRPLSEQADDPARVFAFEWLLRLLHCIACWLVARPVPLDQVAFPYPAPGHAADYELVYSARYSFGAPALVARFSVPLLDLPVRRHEADLNAFLKGAPGRISMLYRRDRETGVRVQEALRTRIGENPALGDIARHLHQSPRTLERRLAAEGTSFRALKSGVRRDLACSRLVKTDLGIEHIAQELGYADTSAFYRAFVGWTGLSPERYRKAPLDRPSPRDPESARAGHTG
ncbi:AraC family transcriptional regulator [Phaeovibrio sulfidiphilus]|uniref:AraC family transcriptional regulator n=2 Tax=Phaeovibrio sulfidiphilus TaxID=1220600 RepID=A0A8J6YQB4_9PROT|nr:AraC family transcriptional regulator [Phaeovibrio sulfidiphilus]